MKAFTHRRNPKIGSKPNFSLLLVRKRKGPLIIFGKSQHTWFTLQSDLNGAETEGAGRVLGERGGKHSQHHEAQDPCDEGQVRVRPLDAR